MPYQIETLQELSNRLAAELPLNMSGVVLRRNLYTPFARALAGAVHGLHGHIDWRVRQMFPQTCDDDILEALHAPLWLGSGRLPATVATGKVLLQGNPDTAIAQGTRLNRADGAVYSVLTGTRIAANGTTMADIAAEQAGTVGNCESGTRLVLTNTISGIETEAVLPDGAAGGADMESIDALRERIIESRKNGKDVGRTGDWARWAKEIPGITRVWPAPKLSGAGTVTVYVMRDNDVEPYPSTDQLAVVQQHLLRSGLPNGEVYVVAPLPRKLNFRVKIMPDTPEIRAAAETALRQLIAKSAAPLAYTETGTLVLPARGQTIPRSHITQALSNAAGEYDHHLFEPTSDIVMNVGDLAELGNIEWIT